MTTVQPTAAVTASDRDHVAFSPDGRRGVCLRRTDEDRALEYWEFARGRPAHRTIPQVRVDRDTRALPLHDGRILLAQRDGRGYEIGLLRPGADDAVEWLGAVPAQLGAQLVARPGSAELGFVVAVDDPEHSTIWRVAPTAPRLTTAARVPGALTGVMWLDDRVLVANQASATHRCSVVVVDPADGAWRRIWSMSDTSIDRVVLAGPRSGLLVVTTTAAGGERLGWGVLGEPTLRFPESVHRPGYLREAVAVDDRGGRVLLHEVDGAVSRLLIYTPAEDRLEPVPGPPGTVSGPASWTEDLIRLRFSAPGRPPTLATVRLGAAPRWSCAPGSGPAAPSAELTVLPGPAGPIEAIVYGGQEWRRSRHLVVALHGGPLSAWRFEFDPLFECLAAAGVAVVAPNCRGSTGYGEDHLRAVVGDWGGPDLDDVLHLGAALERERRGRLPRPVVLGASYGAFLALLAACREPALWSACVALAPFLSGSRLHEAADPAVRHRVEQLGGLAGVGDERGGRDVLRLCGSMTAPLLLVHGSDDRTIPPEQSRTLRHRLLELGRTEGTDLEFLEIDGDHDAVVHARREELRRSVTRFCLDATRGGTRPSRLPEVGRRWRRRKVHR